VSIEGSLSIRKLRKSVVAGVVLFGLGILAANQAAASPASGSISPVGTYTATEHIPVAIPLTQRLVLSPKGHFSLTPRGPRGTWSESHHHITMNGTFGGMDYLITITQSGENLGSKRHPGTIVTDGQAFATWYAVRR
jgi:hypothetical protein